MKTIDLIRKLEQIGKNCYTINDLQKILQLDRKTLRVRLNRLVKAGVLRRLHRGTYALYNKASDIEYLANNLVLPSYISFEYALSRCGLMSEIPYEITLAALKRPRKKIIEGVSILYRQIKRELFFGYELVDGIYIATKEKAYLDCIYFQLFGKAIGFDQNAVPKEKLNKALLFQYSRKYPARVQKQVYEH